MTNKKENMYFFKKFEKYAILYDIFCRKIIEIKYEICYYKYR